MKTTQYIIVAAVILMLLILFSNAALLQAQQPAVRTDICQIEDVFDFGDGPIAVGPVVSVANGDLSAHLLHGDTDSFEIRTLPDGATVCVAD